MNEEEWKNNDYYKNYVDPNRPIYMFSEFDRNVLIPIIDKLIKDQEKPNLWEQC